MCIVSIAPGGGLVPDGCHAFSWTNVDKSQITTASQTLMCQIGFRSFLLSALLREVDWCRMDAMPSLGPVLMLRCKVDSRSFSIAFLFFFLKQRYFRKMLNINNILCRPQIPGETNISLPSWGLIHWFHAWKCVLYVLLSCLIGCVYVC